MYINIVPRTETLPYFMLFYVATERKRRCSGENRENMNENMENILFNKDNYTSSFPIVYKISIER